MCRARVRVIAQQFQCQYVLLVVGLLLWMLSACVCVVGQLGKHLILILILMRNRGEETEREGGGS